MVPRIQPMMIATTLAWVLWRALLDEAGTVGMADGPVDVAGRDDKDREGEFEEGDEPDVAEVVGRVVEMGVEAGDGVEEMEAEVEIGEMESGTLIEVVGIAVEEGVGGRCAEGDGEGVTVGITGGGRDVDGDTGDVDAGDVSPPKVNRVPSGIYASEQLAKFVKLTKEKWPDRSMEKLKSLIR